MYVTYTTIIIRDIWNIHASFHLITTRYDARWLRARLTYHFWICRSHVEIPTLNSRRYLRWAYLCTGIPFSTRYANQLWCVCRLFTGNRALSEGSRETADAVEMSQCYSTTVLSPQAARLHRYVPWICICIIYLYKSSVIQYTAVKYRRSDKETETP